MMRPGAIRYIHATAVLVGESGVLIEGASGAGKSQLALALIGEAQAQGGCGLLVGDDRVGLSAAHGRLLARPHPAVAGLLERRGIGLQRVPFEPACVIRLAVRLAGPDEPRPERLPADHPRVLRCDVSLPLLVLAAGGGSFERARQVLAALRPGDGPACFQPLQSAC